MRSFDLHNIDGTVVVNVDDFAPDDVTDVGAPSFIKPGISAEYAQRIVDAAFDTARHINHARLCPLCSSLLHSCDTGWRCRCGLTMTRDEITAVIGAPTADGGRP